MTTQRIKIGNALKARELITDRHIDYALQEQKITREKLGEILVRTGFVTHTDIAITVAEQEAIDYIDVSKVVPSTEALRLIKYNECVRNRVLPFKIEDNQIHIASANESVVAVNQIVARYCTLHPVVYQCDYSMVTEAIRNHYFFLDHPVEREIEREVDLLRQDTANVRSMDGFITHLFHYAVKLRATDIHIRPMEKSISIAFRIDGVMRSVLALPLIFKRLTTAIKILAEMDIAEMRVPQDGSFNYKIIDTEYDFRASTIVCPYGENLALRLLDTRSGARGFFELGFSDQEAGQLRELFKAPHGVILLTGPTGSGKTTTLYAGLRSQNLLEKNIITIEDPIEYRIPMVRQTEVNVKAGYDFSNAIRHFLRHDPDVILVGEIRDADTADTSISAAETGHLVLSTIHANDAFGVIPRLQSLDVSPFILSDTLLGVIGQRLVRLLCEECKQLQTLSTDELAYLGLNDPNIQIYQPQGCSICDHTGYLGRTPIFEVLTIIPAIAMAIANQATINEIRDIAAQAGIPTIFDNAVIKLQQGVTSIEEIKRVLGITGKTSR